MTMEFVCHILLRIDYESRLFRIINLLHDIIDIQWQYQI